MPADANFSSNRRWASRKCLLGLFATFIIARFATECSIGSSKESFEPKGAPAERLAILPEPAFMRPPVSRPFANSKEVVLALCIVSADGDVRYATPAEAQNINAEWETILEATRVEAARLIAEAEPSVYRGRGDVVQYAWIQSSNPIAGAALLVPSALNEKFRNIFGDKLRIALPARGLIYILPALGTDLQIYGPKFQRLYESNLYPVCLELFEVRRDQITAVGTFRP